MWKKISLVMALGLACCPEAAMAESLFDPFAGIVQGIAQNLVVSGDKLAVESSYDEGGVTGGNVVIGSTSSISSNDEVLQIASTDNGIDLAMNVSTGASQGVNVLKGGEVAVLAMQGAAISGTANITSNTSVNSVQGINLVTSCGSSGCE
jgi:hypothetical protein